MHTDRSIRAEPRAARQRLEPFTNMFARGPANLVPISDEWIKRPSHPKHNSIRAPTCSTDSHHHSLDSDTAFTYRSFRTSWKPLQSFWANSWYLGIRWPAVFRPHHPWLSYFSLAVNDVAYTHTNHNHRLQEPNVNPSQTDVRIWLVTVGRTFGRVWIPSNLFRTVSCSPVYWGGFSRGRRAPSSGLINVPQPQPPQQAVTGQQGAVVSTPRRPAQPSLIVYLLALQIRSVASFITYARTPAARWPNGHS